MGNLEGFNAHEVSPEVGFEPVPAGDYIMIITESLFKPTKAGDGEYLQCTLEVIDGEYKGRKVFARLNLKNKNDTAVRMARAELSAICHAVGCMQPKDSSELHGIPMLVTLNVIQRKDRPGEYSNEIKGYAQLEGHRRPAPDKPQDVAPWRA